MVYKFFKKRRSHEKISVSTMDSLISFCEVPYSLTDKMKDPLRSHEGFYTWEDFFNQKPSRAVQELTEELKQSGTFERPILLRKVHKYFFIVDGLKRLQACRLAGVQEISTASENWKPNIPNPGNLRLEGRLDMGDSSWGDIYNDIEDNLSFRYHGQSYPEWVSVFMSSHTPEKDVIIFDTSDIKNISSKESVNNFSNFVETVEKRYPQFKVTGTKIVSEKTKELS